MAFINFQPKDYFNTVLYTSNNGTSPRTITGVGFNPDMIWVKNRDSASYNHVLSDNVRGIGKIIQPDTTVAESSNSAAGTITATNSDGFVLTAGSSNLSNYDTGTNKQVAWNWKANGQGSANSDGSINTTYTSANTTSGFSISTYTGTGSAATIGHGLGQIPSVVLVKRLNDTEHWVMYHHKSNATPQDYYLRLNDTSAVADFPMWNDTAPTSSVFSVGTNNAVNAIGSTYVAYCFAEKKGFSKFGSYTGNGSTDGVFIYTGFKPAFVLGKNATFAGQHWFMNDNKRGINGGSNWLKADGSDAELTNLVNCDFLSNGFKLRNTNDIFNDSGETLVYMAFAEEPLVSSNGVPNTAG